MDKNKYSFEIQLAKKASENAKKVFLSSVSKPITSRNKDPKSYRELVTKYDQSSEEKILSILKKSQYPILSEESHPQFKHKKDHFWAVDPLDGTINFIHGSPWYSISIGLCIQKNPVLGVVQAPKLRQLFYTKNGNSYCNQDRVKFKPKKLSSSLVAVGFSHRFMSEKEKNSRMAFLSKINDSSLGFVRTGSAALNLSYLTLGQFQCAVGWNTPWWDVAAGLAIAKQSGAKLWIEETSQGRVNYIAGSQSQVDSVLKLKKKLF